MFVEIKYIIKVNCAFYQDFLLLEKSKRSKSVLLFPYKI